MPRPTPAGRRRLARPVTAGALLVLAALLAPGAGAQSSGWGKPQQEEPVETLIRLLPPAALELSGETQFETLLTNPDVHNVVFLVDGELAARRRAPPWVAAVELASPPRRQVVRAEARDRADRLLAFDELTVNRPRGPLRVALRSIEITPGGLLARAELSIPEEVELERLAVFLGEELQRTYLPDELPADELEIAVDAAEPEHDAYLRIVAHLADGRQIEDVALLSATRFQEEVDVQLVQLQVVVTNRRGLPMRGFRKEHFRIVEDGRPREPAGLFVADDVTLLLGLALDSSGSMRRIWPRTRQAAALFVEETMSDRDEGFLVDFDTRLRLVQERTGDRSRLKAALDELEPRGGTALYDSILFSLLQFDRQQGRRGLVVVTDGFDVESQANPERAVEFGRKLGVPIYILALESPGAAGRAAGSRGVSSAISDPAAAVQAMRLLTGPTGGRLFRVGSAQQISRAFTIINAELRNQYVLTYYTDSPPEPGRPPRVEVEAPGQEGLEAKVVFGADQVY